MKIQDAIRTFTEKYDEEAMLSIDNIQDKIGKTYDRLPFTILKFDESTNGFLDYMDGYMNYMKENIGNPNISPRESIKNAVNKYLEDHPIEEQVSTYKMAGEFVKSYVESIQRVETKINEMKEEMEAAGVQLEYVGDMNDYADAYVTKLNEAFEPAMDNLLWASGYNAKHHKTTLINSAHANKVTFL